MMDNGGEFTDRLLIDGNIKEGQSALDVGCGTGDVSFRLARRVGLSGRVVGIDSNDDALQVARDRATEANLGNLTFINADIYDLPSPLAKGRFDIITMRRVLMYLPDKVKAVSAMLEVLRPDGKLVLQEHEANLSAASEHLPLNTKINRLIWNTVKSEGADIALGLKLYGILIEAGATRAEIRAEPILQTADQSAPSAMILRALADRILATGVATQQELTALDLPSLDERLVDERRLAAATYTGETVF